MNTQAPDFPIARSDPSSSSTEDIPPLQRRPITQRKKKRRDSNDNGKEKGAVRDTPKQPLSAYNLFFQHERKVILAETKKKSPPCASIPKSDDDDNDDDDDKKGSGKVGFAGLARTVASRWKRLDPDERKYFDALAAKDKKRYKEELKEYKKLQDQQQRLQQQLQLQQQRQQLQQQQYLYGGESSSSIYEDGHPSSQSQILGETDQHRDSQQSSTYALHEAQHQSQIRTASDQAYQQLMTTMNYAPANNNMQSPSPSIRVGAAPPIAHLADTLDQESIEFIVSTLGSVD